MLLDYEIAVKNWLVKAGEKMTETAKDFFTDENGDTNMISIILVLVIVIALAALFREKIGEMVEKMWQKINSSFNDATDGF